MFLQKFQNNIEKDANALKYFFGGMSTLTTYTIKFE